MRPSLHFRFWLFAAILFEATACSRLESAAGAEKVPWWLLVIFGIIFMAFSALIFIKGVDSPGVTVDAPSGCSKETAVIGMFLFGGLIVVLGVLSAFFPKLGVWIQGYSNIADTANTAWETIGFIAFQLVILGLILGGLYNIVMRRETVTRAGVILSLVWVVLTFAYFYWMVSTGRFRQYFVDPFVSLYSFIFGK